MKNNIRQIFMITAALTIVGSTFLRAQSVYKLDAAKEINLKLSGTSTLHDWTMNASTFKSEAKFGFKPGSERELASLTSLTFELAVLNLSSGENGLDKNAYKALKTHDYNYIDYKLISATVIPKEGNKYLLRTNGSLTIAGVTKEITMDVYCAVNNNGTITCTGSYKLNMTDYQVKPPTFMLGVMKTGDGITLAFTLVYRKQITS